MHEKKSKNTELANKQKLLIPENEKKSHGKKPLPKKAGYQDSDSDIISSDDLNSLSDNIDDIDDLDDDDLSLDDLSDETQEETMSEVQSIMKGKLSDENNSKLNTERRHSRDSSNSRNPQGFDNFYEKSCKRFLLNREEKLDKKRKQKEEEEIKSVTSKPNLVAKQQTRHIPLLERVKITQARKNNEIQKIKREREEQAEKELQGLTFKPKINEISKALINHMNREGFADRLYSANKPEGSGYPEDSNKYMPKINKNSAELAQNVIKKTSAKVEERLLIQAELIKSKKQKLLEEEKPNFVPKLNKNTQKIVDYRRSKDVTMISKAETRLEQSDFRYIPHDNKRGSISELGSHSFDIARNKDATPEKTRGENVIQKTKSSLKINGVDMDDQLMQNLKQLTLLLQSDIRSPLENKQSRSKTPRKEK